MWTTVSCGDVSWYIVPVEVVSFCPLRAASLLWMPRSGAYVLTVIIKATFEIAPGICSLAAQQEEPNEYDNHWNDDDSRSLYAPSDVVPFKPRADVVLVGHAFSQTATRSLSTRLVVAEVDKAIEVWCDRLLAPDGVIREGAPFLKLPLRYERAAYNPDNPVGIPAEPRADKGGAVVLPNLQPPGTRITGSADTIVPIGYGPIASSWPSRAAKLPRQTAGPPPTFHHQPLPEGLDPGFFNVAPLDQQVERLSADEQIVLENLHPTHPKLITKLPGIAPKVTVERGGKADEIVTSADTLWFDTDRALCTLTWRGQLRLERPDFPGRVSITMVKNSLETSAPRLDGTMAINIDDFGQGAGAGQRSAAPQKGKADDPENTFGEVTMVPFGTGAPGFTLPFAPKSADQQEGMPAWPPPAAAPDRSDEGAGSTQLVSASAMQIMTLPFAPFSDAPASSPDPNAAPPFSPLPVPPAPPLVPIAYPVVAPAVPVGPAVMPAAPPPLISSLASSDPTLDAAIIPPKIGSVASLKDVGVVPGMPPPSAAAASNAAADPWSPGGGIDAGPMSPLRPRTPVELIWFDPAFVDAIRRDPDMKAILAENQKLKVSKKSDKKQPAGSPSPAQLAQQDREDINSVIALGNPSRVDVLGTALAGAVNDQGIFHPPILLLAGDLSFPFDELETLKATIAAVTPLAAGDKKLKETIDTVGELLRTPWLQAAGSVTERLTAQVKEAFAAGNRVLPQGYLETHTERILLEQRHYQKRVLLGQTWIRALLGAPGNSTRVPTYIPHSLARDLPIYQHLPVRLIAEVRAQIDQYETHPSALRVLALGRVLGGAPCR